MATSYSDISTLNDDCQRIAADSRARVDEKKTDIGWLGAFWGAGKNSGYNVAGLSVILCLLVGLFCIIWNIVKGNGGIGDTWNQLSSIITLALGYLFGSKSQDKS